MTKLMYERPKSRKKKKPSDKSNVKGSGRQHPDKTRLVLVILVIHGTRSITSSGRSEKRPADSLPSLALSLCLSSFRAFSHWLSLPEATGGLKKDERFHVEIFNMSQPRILSRKCKPVLAWAELELRNYKGPENHIWISYSMINVFDHKFFWPSWKKLLT